LPFLVIENELLKIRQFFLMTKLF